MALSSDLLTPIDGENPAGVDLRYDPVYDKIKEARREDLDIPAGDWEAPRKTADWPQVIKLATDALAKRTKDLQIAVWLTEALLRKDGFGGLREGLELIDSLITNFWDHLYPEIEDGDAALRAAPLSWLGLKLDVAAKMAPVTRSGVSYLSYVESQKIPTEAEAEAEYEDTKRNARAAAIAEGKITPEEFEKEFAATPKEWYRQLVADIEGCLEILASLDSKGDELFADEAPSYRGLQGALEEVERAARQFLSRKLEIEPDPVEVAPQEAIIAEAPPESVGSPAATVAAAPAAVSAGGIAPTPTNVADAAARIAAAARFLRSQDPTNPAPYLMLRGFRWGELRAGGATVDPKLLEAPPTDVRVRLKMLYLDKKWSALLEAAEEVMATPYGRGWLDLQRQALTACDALGSEYENVAAGIRGALRSLLEDLPDLPNLTLMDDSPTANAETLRWLESEGMLAGGGGSDDAPRRTGGVERPGREREPRERALEYVKAGNPAKGIEYLMQEAARARSERARFLRRLEATSIMVDTGRESVAYPILQELKDQIEKFQLEEWEAGEVVAEPLGLLYRCLQKMGYDSSSTEELYLKICRLDPIYAMSLGNSSDGSEPTEQSGW